jgi:outer membrane protein assembly factor BamB
MAVIELDLTAQPGPPLSSRPPAYRYRLPGLVFVALLVAALGGAAPVRPTLWRFLGSVPGGSAEFPFRLGGGRAYTVSAQGAVRSVVAWQLQKPPRRLWTARVTIPAAGPDAVPLGGILAQQAGDLLLFAEGAATTALDLRTGKPRWSAPVNVTPLAGGRYGVQQTEEFRAGTVYDQESGASGPLYFSSTGEPHTEPPTRSEVSGVDLRTGARLWSATVPGSVNVFPAPGREAAVLVLASDRLERLDGRSGAVLRQVGLPAAGGASVSGGLADDLVLVDYGDYRSGGREVAYDAGTLARRWERSRPDAQEDPPVCAAVLCSGPRSALDVIDPATGRVAWRAPGHVDLIDRGEYILEVGADSGTPVRLADPATGAARVELTGWGEEIFSTGPPLVLRKAGPGGRSVFAVVRSDRDRLQLLGEGPGALYECAADEAYVICRANRDSKLQIWAYRA